MNRDGSASQASQNTRSVAGEDRLHCRLPLLPIVPWSWVDLHDPIPGRVLWISLHVAVTLVAGLVVVGWLVTDLLSIG